MFGNLRRDSWFVGHLAGIPLFVHWSALILVLSAGQRSDGGAVGLILVLISLLIGILLHELGHGLTARAFGASGLTITLWALGGLCESRRDPSRLGREMLIVAAGPAVSAALWGASWWLLHYLAQHQPGLISSGGELNLFGQFLRHFAKIQLMLLMFNLLPIYPLDGGQLTYLGSLGLTRNQLLARQISLFLAVFGALFWFCWATGLVGCYVDGVRDPIGTWLQLMSANLVFTVLLALFLGFLLNSAFLYLH